jgi:hypothetical protein
MVRREIGARLAYPSFLLIARPQTGETRAWSYAEPFREYRGKFARTPLQCRPRPACIAKLSDLGEKDTDTSDGPLPSALAGCVPPDRLTIGIAIGGDIPP